MKILSIVIITVLNWTACLGYYTQTDSVEVDSSLTYTAKVWEMNALIFETSKGRQCEKLVEALNVEVEKGVNVQFALKEENDNLIHQSISLSQAVAFAKAGEKEEREKAEIQKDISNHHRKGKNKWKGVTVLAFIVGLLI